MLIVTLVFLLAPFILGKTGNDLFTIGCFITSGLFAIAFEIDYCSSIFYKNIRKQEEDKNEK